MQYLVNFLFISELIGTVAFAASGAIKAIKYKYDIMGIVTIGTITGIGGGILRDEIISDNTPGAFIDLKYAYIAIVISLLVYAFYMLKNKGILKHSIANKMVYDICDAIGLGVFAINGTNAALENGAFTAVIMGMLTAAGGGILRDILCLERPRVFKEEIYITAALAGSFTFYTLVQIGLSSIIVASLSILLAVMIRLMSIKWQWELPRAS